jgi:hypothetical protein
MQKKELFVDASKSKKPVVRNSSAGTPQPSLAERILKEIEKLKAGGKASNIVGVKKN